MSSKLGWRKGFDDRSLLIHTSLGDTFEIYGDNKKTCHLQAGSSDFDQLPTKKDNVLYGLARKRLAPHKERRDILSMDGNVQNYHIWIRQGEEYCSQKSFLVPAS